MGNSVFCDGKRTKLPISKTILLGAKDRKELHLQQNKQKITFTV